MDDSDRLQHLDILAQTIGRFDAALLAYCLMGNHYHLVLQTQQPNLSRLMRHFNGVYTQRFNRRHGLVGHLFQGRFKAILVDSETYLVALCRYVERNPVAAGLAATAGDWPWSSCRAHIGAAATPAWLDVEAVHASLLGRSSRGPSDRARAAARYAQIVVAPDSASPWENGLRQQVFLGDEEFVLRALEHGHPNSKCSRDVPRRQRQPPRDLASFVAQTGDRDRALHTAYRDGGMTMTQLARESGLSVSRVSRLIGAIEKSKSE
jgi:REP element-mobilizing transposase RayT